MVRVKLLTVLAVSFFFGLCVMVGYHVYDIKIYSIVTLMEPSTRPLVIPSGAWEIHCVEL